LLKTFLRRGGGFDRASRRRIIPPLKNETGPPQPFRRRHGAAAGVLLAANVLFFWPVLFHQRVFSSHDVTLATYPWRGVSGVSAPRNRLLADPATSSETQLRKFRDFPRGFFWNRSMACGTPGPVNFVQGNLSPFFWLPAIALPEAAIETGIIFLKLNFGFLFGYLFLRRRFSGIAASAGAAAWGWTSAQTCWWLWMHTSVSIFYPLVLLAVDHAFASRRFASAAAVSGGVFLGMLSGGYPFWIVFGAVAGALYFAFRAAELGGAPAGRAALRLAAGGVLALAIVAPAALLSYRFLRETGHISSREGIGARNPMPLRQVRLFFLPDYNGDPRADDYTGVGLGAIDNYFETAVGVGPVAFGLAALGLASRRRRRLVAFAASLGLAIAAPLYAGGPLLKAVGGLPGFSEGHFERAKILIVLAIAISCAGKSSSRRISFATRPRFAARSRRFRTPSRSPSSSSRRRSTRRCRRKRPSFATRPEYRCCGKGDAALIASSRPVGRSCRTWPRPWGSRTCADTSSTRRATGRCSARRTRSSTAPRERF